MTRLQRLFHAALLASTAVAVSPQVDLGCTSYVGTALANGLTQWLGMRYAAAPLGDLRFMAPQEPLCHDEPQLADTVRWLCQFPRQLHVSC